MTNSELERNKAVVVRFNREAIEQGSDAALRELVAPEFVNRTAAPGTPPGVQGLDQMLNGVLRKAFPDMRVEIHDQIAERDLVTTRKTIHATHRGELLGVPATGKRVALQIIDIVRVQGGRYVEHWASNNLASVLAELRGR